MYLLIDAMIVLLILTNLKFVASSRIISCIRVVAFQGVLLGALPLLIGADTETTLRACGLSAITVILKGIVFPRLLYRAQLSTHAHRENRPLVGYTQSILISAVLFALSMWIGGRLPLPVHVTTSFMLPLAMFNLLIGLFVIISRKNALTQVLGYLVMENGIYAFGLAFALEEPFLVELGVLLDVFMAVFVMGIAIFYIGREFEHMDTAQMSLLKD